VGKRVGGLLLIGSLNACSPNGSTQPPPAPSSAATASTAQSTPAAKPKQQPEWVREQGASDDQVTWLPAKPDQAVGGLAGHSQSYLEPSKIGLNNDFLTLYMKLSRPTDRADLDDKPSVRLLLDDCPVSAPSIEPTALARDGSEKPVRIRRASLPQGDLTLVVAALGSETTMFFRNDEQGLEPITERDLRNVSFRAGDPARDVPDSWDHLVPDCTRRQP
jgi:hypothetical protein